jgi:hypothetical protein
MKADVIALLRREINWSMEIKNPREDIALIAKFMFMSLLIFSLFFDSSMIPIKIPTNQKERIKSP